jgi:hypothetical protein
MIVLMHASNITILAYGGNTSSMSPYISVEPLPRLEKVIDPRPSQLLSEGNVIHFHYSTFDGVIIKFLFYLKSLNVY